MRKFSIASIGIFCLSVITVVVFMLFFRKEVDKSGPVISMETDYIDGKTDISEEALLKGVTAKDKKDGDVTDSIVIENISKFWASGKRTVNYAAFDSDGNVAKASRTLTYIDYKSPEFSIIKPMVVSLEDTGSALEYVTAKDYAEGDISNLIKATPETYEEGSGRNKIVFSVTNRMGDRVEITVNVVITDSPGDANAFDFSRYIVYCDKGESVDPFDYLNSVRVNGNVYAGYEAKDVVKTQGEVDFNTSGSYQIDFSVTDTDEESGQSKEITVPFIVVVR